jgi:hypothetical protein
MTKRFWIFAAILVLTGAGFAGPARAQIFQFSDTSLGFRYGDNFREPGYADSKNPHGIDINKDIISITHVDGWEYGTNFLNVDILKSFSRNPRADSTEGAIEVYAVYRADFSPNSIFKTDLFTFGPVRDVTLELGTDLNTKNDPFGSQKKLLVLGPNFHFDVPGFLNIAFLYGHEWNRNSIAHTDDNFNPQLIISAVYSFPLDFIHFAPLRFDGFTNINSPKGINGFQQKTDWEVLSQNRLVLDFGQVALNKPKFLDVFIGFEYWLNKFGNNHNLVPGSLAYTPFIGTAVHF